MHIHVAVVGLVRSFSDCLPSLNKRVLSFLPRFPGISISSSFHLSRTKVSLRNLRTNEFGAPEYAVEHLLGNQPYFFFETKALREESKSLLETILPSGEWLEGGGRNLQNYLEALTLLKSANTQLRDFPADAYLYVRPDLKMLDPFIPVPGMTISTQKVLTPAWGRWGGLNDRMAIVPQRYANDYFSRLDTVVDFVNENGPFHPERHLAYALRNIPNEARLRFEAIRVRTGGVLEDIDLKRLNASGLRGRIHARKLLSN